MKFEIDKIQEHPELIQAAAEWFHAKWDIPLEAYLDSMNKCLECKSIIPQWYLVRNKEEIIGGLGVIENDFHNRKDLTPNVCSVYVEKNYRCQGIAGELLNQVCLDMQKNGIPTLYLVTDHTSFYERYGWEFLCMVQGEGEAEQIRMYIHKMQKDIPKASITDHPNYKHPF